MKTLYGLLLFTLLTSACKQQESGSQSSSSTPNFTGSSCTIGKWSASPIDLRMSSEFTSDYTNTDLVNGLNPLEVMAKTWNNAVASGGVTLFTTPFAATSTTGYANLSGFRDNEFGIYKSHNWFAGVSSSALAITQFYGIVRSNGSLGTYIDLTHADIIVNYRDFGSELTMTGNPLIDYDLPTIILHEMGHFLGLCHENAHTSIMAPYYFTTQRTLKTFDTNKIRALYLNNQNYSGLTARKSSSNGIISGAVSDPTMPEGTPVSGIVELNADGNCKHYIEGKLVYEHDAGNAVPKTRLPRWYKNLPLR